MSNLLKLTYFVTLHQGRREPNVGPGTSQTWIGTLKLEGPPLELKYDVMGPLVLDGPPLELKYDVMGPRPKSSDLKKKKKGLHRNFDCFSGLNQMIPFITQCNFDGPLSSPWAP